MALLLFAPPSLPLAPSAYDPEYFNQVLRSLNVYLTQIGSTTPIVIDSLTLLALPTSALDQNHRTYKNHRSSPQSCQRRILYQWI